MISRSRIREKAIKVHKLIEKDDPAEQLSVLSALAVIYFSVSADVKDPRALFVHLMGETWDQMHQDPAFMELLHDE